MTEMLKQVVSNGTGKNANFAGQEIAGKTGTISQKIATAIRISKRTLTIVHQNIVFALGVKFIVLILSALGLGNMWIAVFADVGVSVLAILNAMRCLRVEEFRK